MSFCLLAIDDMPKKEREQRGERKVYREQQPHVPIPSQDSEDDEQHRHREQDAGGLDMVQPRAQEQVVDMVLVGLERGTVVYDTGKTHTDGVEDRHRQYAYSHHRSRRHPVFSRYEMVCIHLAEAEDKGGEHIAQQQRARVAHEDFLFFTEHIVAEKHSQRTNKANRYNRPFGLAHEGKVQGKEQTVEHA